MKKKILSLFLVAMLLMSTLSMLSVGATDGSEAVSVYSGTPDIEFWDAAMESEEITINTADQLMAFATLTNSFNFDGYTIKLGADMTINEGDASTWGTTAPTHTWQCSTGWGNRFAGNFDGQGHTISGLYSNYGQECGLFGTITGGNTIQNVKVVNSYFGWTTNEGNTSDVFLQGGIVGFIDGYHDNGVWNNKTTTIKNVSVDAILYTDCTVATPSNYAEKVGAGGIVGLMTNAATQSLVLENCSFNGSITSTYSYTGGLVGNVRDIASITVKDCAVNADISVKGSSSAKAYAGGFIGQCKNPGTFTVSDCLVAGSFKIEGNNDNTSAFIGYAHASSGTNRTLTVNNVIVAVTPVPTGENSDVIFACLLFECWPSGTLNANFTNVKYDAGVYEFPEDMKHIYKAGVNSNGSLTGEDFEATACESSELKGVAVFEDWTVVDGDYPVPTTPIVINHGASNDQTNNENNNNSNNNSNTNNTANENKNDKDETDADTTAPAEDTTEAAEDEGGCGSSVSVAGMVALVMGVAVIALALSKKKIRN